MADLLTPNWCQSGRRFKKARWYIDRRIAQLEEK